MPTRNHESHSASPEAVHRDGSGEIAPESSRGAINRIADRLGVHPEALRNGVRQAEIDGGFRSGTTTGDADRIAQQERENRELRRANTIAKQASALFGRRSTAQR
ncbi:transposase [Gordonia alkanivorans]|uniref:transposase n=1 Tax=Gordonia alkanivorans TaxID=84096 RepID=UPI003B980C33